MTFLERYKAGEHAAVWEEMTALGAEVRSDRYYADASGVAAETMRRARHNVEILIQRLDALGYRFADQVSAAEDQLSRLDTVAQLSSQIEGHAAMHSGRYNAHLLKMLGDLRGMQSRMAPQLERAAAQAAQAASAKRKPPLEDSNVFSPPNKKTAGVLAELEKALGGPLPISLRAWYEQVGGVSLMGSHAVLNAVNSPKRGMATTFGLLGAQASPPRWPSGDYAPDPLVIYSAEELLDQLSEREGEEEDGGYELVLAPDDLHKANISGDATYVLLPDAGADFEFDDWHATTFVKYLRAVFEWGGFPGWARGDNAPRQEIGVLTEGLLAL